MTVTKIDLHQITNDSVIVVYMDASSSPLREETDSPDRLGKWCQERGIDPLYILVNDGSRIEVFDEAMMNSAGWYRKPAMPPTPSEFLLDMPILCPECTARFGKTEMYRTKTTFTCGTPDCKFFGKTFRLPTITLEQLP